jgi:hypothetical protein
MKKRILMTPLLFLSLINGAEEQQGLGFWEQIKAFASSKFSNKANDDLFVGVKTNDLALVEDALAKGANANQKIYSTLNLISPRTGKYAPYSIRSSTLLNEAVKRNNLPIINALLKGGSDPNVQFITMLEGPVRETALNYAANDTVADILLKAGAQVIMDSDPANDPANDPASYPAPKSVNWSRSLSPLGSAIKRNRKSVINALLQEAVRKGLTQEIGQEVLAADRPDISDYFQKLNPNFAESLKTQPPKGSYLSSCDNCQVTITETAKELRCNCKSRRSRSNSTSVILPKNAAFTDITNRNGQLTIIK